MSDVESTCSYDGYSKPNSSLISGTREDYLSIGVPLYEAAITCNWKAAHAILSLEDNKDLVRTSITENEETALHVAASAKGKNVEEFVKNLVDMMEKEDLELVNKNSNTALYLAATAGNVETVKIMMQKNRNLQSIWGDNEMLPLCAAVLFGNYDVAKYLYQESNGLSDVCLNVKDLSRLLEKCVENDMFDIALKIVTKFTEYLCGESNGTILGVLAGKPEAFAETKSNIIGKTIKFSKHLYSKFITTHQPSENKLPESSNGSAPSQMHGASRETKANIIGRSIMSVFTFMGSRLGVDHEKKNQALSILRIVWKDIAKMHNKDIDMILRGPRDSVNKSTSGRVVQAIQLKKLINDHLDRMENKTKNIIATQGTNLRYGVLDHVDQLQNLISEYIVNLHLTTQEIVKQDNTPLVGKRDLVLELEKLISNHIVSIHDGTQDIIKKTFELEQAQKIQELIFEKISEMRRKVYRQETYSSQVLFLAAEAGNTTFIAELLRQYPDLIWKVNDNGLSIFHIAVKYRHEGIYTLLHEIGAMKDVITPLRDEHENNMLHLVGKRAKQKKLEDMSGVALQMQRELLWFQEVKKMMPPHLREGKNRDGLTPQELFTLEHTDLVTQGEKWMKSTASQCIVVAALIATIVFAAAFTVPGGYDQNNGSPIFYSKVTFMVFVVADSISLFASSTSILLFLSILTSRYDESDFLKSLPNKLISGLLTLFLSIAAMSVSFCVSLFILYHKGLSWVPILSSVFGVFPVLLYICLQFKLFLNVISSKYWSTDLFKPKHVIYYKNPKI